MPVNWAKPTVPTSSIPHAMGKPMNKLANRTSSPIIEINMKQLRLYRRGERKICSKAANAAMPVMIEMA